MNKTTINEYINIYIYTSIYLFFHMYIILLLYLSTFINLLGQTYQDNSSRPTSAQVSDWSNQKFRLFEPTNIFLKARNITFGGAPDTIRVDKPRNTNVPPPPPPHSRIPSCVWGFGFGCGRFFYMSVVEL